MAGLLNIVMLMATLKTLTSNVGGNDMANMTFTAGRILCGKVRSFLDQCKFKGMDIDYIESSGWVQRDFLIRGCDKDILTVYKSLKNWADNLDE